MVRGGFVTIDEFLALIARSPQHKCFYHFTDRQNLTSIGRCGGLLPTKTLRKMDIAFIPAGNEVSLAVPILATVPTPAIHHAQRCIHASNARRCSRRRPTCLVEED